MASKHNISVSNATPDPEQGYRSMYKNRLSHVSRNTKLPSFKQGPGQYSMHTEQYSPMYYLNVLSEPIANRVGVLKLMHSHAVEMKHKMSHMHVHASSHPPLMTSMAVDVMSCSMLSIVKSRELSTLLLDHEHGTVWSLWTEHQSKTVQR